MIRWYVGPALIALGLALLFFVGCAPVLEWDGRLPRGDVEAYGPPGCTYRIGTQARCWGCRMTAYGDDFYCDQFYIGPLIEWRL